MATSHDQHQMLPETIGVAIESERETQRLRAECLKLVPGWRCRDRFPGSQVVPLTQRNIETIVQEEYYVCEKSDGVRYLVMILLDERDEQHVYLVDRKFRFSKVRRSFPDVLSGGRMLGGTLLDGEMVFDNDGTKITTRLLLFDILSLRGTSVMNLDLNRRLGHLDSDINRPARRSGRPDDDFDVSMKDFKKVKYVDHLLNEVIDKGLLHHGNDGLIFTPVNHPYEVGTCQKLLKWKPDEQNTIDFALNSKSRIQGDAYQVYIGQRGQLSPSTWILLDEDDKEAILPQLETGRTVIIECQWIPDRICLAERGSWKFVRFRNDKDKPNDISVLHKTIEMINNPVSRELLISVSKQPITAPAQSHPPPPRHQSQSHRQDRVYDQHRATPYDRPSHSQPRK